MAVGGISIGGYLSAVSVHLCRDVNIPLRLQILNVPACDSNNVFTPEGQFDRVNWPHESYREVKFTPALPTARMTYLHKHFLEVPRPVRSEEGWRINSMLASSLGLALAQRLQRKWTVYETEEKLKLESWKAEGCWLYTVK